VAALASRRGASVTLWTSGGPRSFRLRRRHDLTSWLSFLSDERAQGQSGLRALLAEPARLGAAGRVFLVGDLFDLEPGDLSRVFRRGRELLLCQLLAPEEREAPEGRITWWDAEGGGRREVDVDREVRRSYEEGVSAWIEEWRALAARHRVAFGSWTSEARFETILEALLA